MPLSTGDPPSWSKPAPLSTTDPALRVDPSSLPLGDWSLPAISAPLGVLIAPEAV
jgi:hypothetical protein